MSLPEFNLRKYLNASHDIIIHKVPLGFKDCDMILCNTGLLDWSWWNVSIQFWGDTSCSRDPDFQLGLKLLLQLSGQVILVPTGVYWCILARPAGADGNQMKWDWTVLKEERGSKKSSDQTTLQSSLFSSSSLLLRFCPWVHATSSMDRK